MVTALGGPGDLVDNPAAYLPAAEVTSRVAATRDGYVDSIDTRSVGLVVVALGGGRLRVDDQVDHSVGLTDVVAVGEHVDRGSAAGRRARSQRVRRDCRRRRARAPLVRSVMLRRHPARSSLRESPRSCGKSGGRRVSPGSVQRSLPDDTVVARQCPS